ncbi:MAG: SRPBCC domain-containing protein [Microterricola sp.]
MSARPTGRLSQRDDGLYVLFDRLFKAPIEDVWHSLVNPTAMAKWIGTYTGNPATGGVRFLMSAEEGGEWQYVTILECDPPHRFVADSSEGELKLRVFCHLRESGGMTTLTFGQRIASVAETASMGPGWDYYLDRLVAARRDLPMPEWDDYFPAHSEYYLELVPPTR